MEAKARKGFLVGGRVEPREGARLFTLKELDTKTLDRLSKSGDLIRLENVLLSHHGKETITFDVIESNLEPTEEDLAIFGDAELVHHVRYTHKYHLLDKKGKKSDLLHVEHDHEEKVHPGFIQPFKFLEAKGNWDALENLYVATLIGHVEKRGKKFALKVEKLLLHKAIPDDILKVLEGFKP